MSQSVNPAYRIFATLVLCLGLAATAVAKPEPEACITLGALAYDDWTSTDAGGSGLPAGESNVEYLRCKSCHGWERLGQWGGYVRRERTAEQPNTGLGDTNTVSRDIAVGLGHYYEIDIEDILHTGTGRAFEDGSGSWVELGDNPTNEELAAHAAGYTLGNLHPDLSTTGANAGDIVLTQDQVECLVDFINFADADPKFYFQAIVEERDPVLYEINSGASAAAGENFYNGTCRTCHGEPGEDGNSGRPEGGIAAYMQRDGAYSEFVHKARWGIPDTVMTRAILGEPTSQNMIDVMLYLQEYVAGTTEFTINNGTSGTWYQLARDGEGFLLDVALRDEATWEMVATYYTYDGAGNQVWLIGSAITVGDSVTIPVQITSGGIFGTQFNPLTVNKADWGTLEFTFSGCWDGHVTATPNQAMLDAGMGFEAVEFDITRLTPPSGCP